MSGYASRILTAMRSGVFYRPCDLAAETNLPIGECAKVLKMLHDGGLVELEHGNEYRRKKMYKTKQRELL